MAYALTFDIKHVTLAIYDQEQSQLSRDLTKRFQGTEYFRFVGIHQEL